ncbi:MAG: hypothetical protein NT062_36780 [Proteobacteria bacterium]|nr:hypothetical protein [Pseudomonadota bacterium]
MASLDLEDDVIEHLRVGKLGAEQSWDVPHRPSVPLRVVLATSGLEYIGSSKGGLHFADRQSGLGVQYGHGHWIDGVGVTTDITAKFDGSRIIFDVPESIVASSVFPATLDPTISAEYSMDAPIYSGAPDAQITTAIGHSGQINREFIVVWSDRRRTLNLKYDVFGARVSRTGVIADPVGVLISPAEINANFRFPTVRWSDLLQHYLVVYIEDDSGLGKLGARTIPPFGGAAGSTNNLVSACTASTSACSNPHLARNTDSTGEHFVVVWEESGNISSAGLTLTQANPLVFSAQVNSGVVLAANKPRIAGSGIPQSGTTHFVMVADQPSVGSVTGVELGNDGAIVGSPGVLASNTLPGGGVVGNPDIAYAAGYNEWVMTFDQVIGSDTVVYVAPVILVPFSPGQLSHPFTLSTLVVASGVGRQSNPAIAGYGSSNLQMLVAWRDTPDPTLQVPAPPSKVYSRRLTINPSTGSVATLGSQILSGAASSVFQKSESRIAVHSDEFASYFLTWPDVRADKSNADIWGNRISFSGVASNEFLISASANRQTAPAIAQCNGKYLVAWSDTRNGFPNVDIFGTLLNADGTVQLPAIPLGTGSGIQTNAAIGCNGTQFLVVYQNEAVGSGDIYGVRVNALTGVLVGSSSTIASTLGAELHPRVAFGANDWHVIWDYNGAEIQTIAVSGSTGTPIGSPRAVNIDHTIGSFPDIAFDGTAFLAVWQSIPAGGGLDIVGGLVDPDGTVHSVFGIASGTQAQRSPRVAFDGDNYQVLYEDDRNLATAGVDIFATTVKPSTVLAGTYPVATGGENELAPQVSRRGSTGRLIEATYYRSGLAEYFDFDVWGQSIDTGATAGAAVVVSSTTAVREMTSAVACLTSTSCVVPYRWFNPADSTTDVDRIKARILTYP